jgi:hypothetical protein
MFSINTSRRDLYLLTLSRLTRRGLGGSTIEVEADLMDNFLSISRLVGGGAGAAAAAPGERGLVWPGMVSSRSCSGR